MYTLYFWMSQPQVMSRTPINQSLLMHLGLLDSTESFTWRKHSYHSGCFSLSMRQKSHLLHFQKQLLIPELREHSLASIALAVVDDEHWNVANDPIYPACLAEFRKRHAASQASQADKSVKKSGTGGGGPPLAMTLPQQPAPNLLPHLF